MLWCKILVTRVCCVLLLMLLLTGISPVASAERILLVPLELQQSGLISAKIPQFERGLAPKLMSCFNADFRQVVLQNLPSFESAAYQTRLIGQMPDSVKAALTFMADYEVFRSDDRMISIIQRVYQYTGGAHGMTIQTGHTIDLISGQRLNLADLFLPDANYTDRLSQFVREEGAARQLPMWDFKGIGPQSAFYLTDKGLVLFFQQYEIAPYSAGIVRMTVSYGLLADILKPGIAR